MAEPEKPLRVMAYANILIAGILFPRWFHEFLRHALKGDFKLVLSAQTYSGGLGAYGARHLTLAAGFGAVPGRLRLRGGS